MAKLLNWRGFDQKIREKNILLFSALDICRLFGSSPVAASFLLHRYCKKGYIVRLKQNLYSLPDNLPPDLFIANKMVSPSYVSLEFALSYHQAIPEAVYEITSVTTKTTRRFEALGKIFSYRSLKKEAFTGYVTTRQKGFSFLIAEPEKAFVDICYFQSSHPWDSSRLAKKKLDWDKVIHYATLFQNKRLTDRMESERP